MKEIRQFLESLKVGDEVLICRGGYHKIEGKVERMTGTQILCAGIRFRRADGMQMGRSGFARARIGPISEEDRLQLRRDRLIVKFSSMDMAEWAKLSVEQLEEVGKILESAYKALDATVAT